MGKHEASRAPNNRTVKLDPSDIGRLEALILNGPKAGSETLSKIVFGDAFEILPELGSGRFDLLFADPPYNLTKEFGISTFREKSDEDYEAWLESWISLCVPLLKPTASVYICGDWRSSGSIQRIGSKYFKLRNRITWEREKGRGAKANWKNAAEDIWYFTVSDDFTFNLDAVKQRRRVLAPYKDNGQPKDWDETADGKFRDTHPSNIWTDITVPFWSMSENTDHPTQKPEKLLAKIILASTNKGDLILDPFAGSGTTAVVAKKLRRKFVAVEADENYCLLAAKRLEMAESDSSIQGFEHGVFWERNSGKK
ncbi:MAG: site-specific DNA-methyltransferase [Acidobacteria bacterium]|nr:site-specific DNA-methyltransferase [Acidobacteriota bacterium]MBK9529249.1 site-specific DNA-methyltransferase [Acidobacteriota bacterium]MBP7474213.1 site-specific DNA-methyltransferase [Pyrinomonadaceae bacterium]MBP9109817.1 site-specific DNA-methyltransferase [Pyrinomonadaceae bacterium]